MNFNTFRRGGLFDPITFGSGEDLAKSAGGFFEGFGKPIMSASNPADLKIMADKALSRGDAQSAVLYGQMAQKIEDQYKQQADLRQAQRSALNKMHNENDVLLAEQAGIDKKAAADKQKAERIAQLAEKRVGKEQAAILRDLDPQAAASVLQTMLNGAKVDKKFKELVNDNGDTETWVVDENGNKLKMVGVSKLSDHSKDSLSPEQKSKRVKSLQDEIDAAVFVDTALDDAMELTNAWFASGFGSSIASKFDGTSAKNLRSKLETIKANIGFDRLRRMRLNSPTGGALGQVAVQELVALQASLTSLDQAQTDKQLRDALSAVKTHYSKIMDAARQEASDLSGTDGDWAIVE